MHRGNLHEKSVLFYFTLSLTGRPAAEKKENRTRRRSAGCARRTPRTHCMLQTLGKMIYRLSKQRPTHTTFAILITTRGKGYGH
jgi:hypothetical protein